MIAPRADDAQARAAQVADEFAIVGVAFVYDWQDRLELIDKIETAITDAEQAARAAGWAECQARAVAVCRVKADRWQIESGRGYNAQVRQRAGACEDVANDCADAIAALAPSSGAAGATKEN